MGRMGKLGILSLYTGINLVQLVSHFSVNGRGAECGYRGYRRYRAATYPSGQQASITKIFLLGFCANGQSRSAQAFVSLVIFLETNII